MNAIPRLPPDQQMTIEEFLDFTQSRPHGERWELIEGVAVMNASPIDHHQMITANIVGYLLQKKEQNGASWLPLLGVGTRVPIAANSLPQPDDFVMAGPLTGRPLTDDALVIFEVLSRSNTTADQAWRRRVYSSVENCEHYVTVSLRTAEIVAFDRATGWAMRTVDGLDSLLDLPAIGVSMPLSTVYRYTPLAGA